MLTLSDASLPSALPSTSAVAASEADSDRSISISQRQRQRQRRWQQRSLMSHHLIMQTCYACATVSPTNTGRRSWTRALIAVVVPMAFQIIATGLFLICIPIVSAHGYLKMPRSRNLVAYQDKNDEMPDKNDPKPEDCPHCLNRGGNLAQCGILFGTREGEPWERNYDKPLNIRNGPMPSNLQGVYREGGEIEVEVLVTTHHKGHFEFAVCPVDDTLPMEIPTKECFERNKLTFLSDEMYGAPVDTMHPERAYIAPASKAEWTAAAPGVQPVVGAYYKMKFQLPPGLAGNVVLLQWYYLTANSCKHEGYAEYPFPEEWGSDVALYPGLPDCGEVPSDGNGVPEQFWNCAEIKIVGMGSQSTPASRPYAAQDTMVSMTSAAEAVPTTPRPTTSPTPYQPCQNSVSTYYEATDDCTGYYICMSGEQGEVHYCMGYGMLYDEANGMCNWADEVTCGAARAVEGPLLDENGNPLPTESPTPAPTREPKFPDWTPKTPEERGHDKTIIAYYASWQWYDRNGLAEPAAFDWNKITRVNFAFFQITPQGDIYGTDVWADPITLFGFYDWMSEKGTTNEYCSWDAPGVPPNCMAHNFEEGLIYLAHEAGAEVYPSIGGWSLSDPFPVMASDARAREHFASQCVELIKNYNFDGIDLDWEYPGYEPHSGTPEDTVNFNLLLDDVRAALDGLEAETGKFYGLTAALPCGPSIIDNQDIAHVGRLLTELNLMTYDFHGSWNNITGVNAPLYDQNGSPEFSVHGCVGNWLKGGAPREKINIGFPFYGRSFLNAEHLYEPHEGNDEITWHMDEGVPQYYNILDKMSDQFTSVRDDQTMTQYLYQRTGMVSYDDERAICDKTEYAQIHDLNGYIIWEISGDLMPDLSTPLLDAANAKLHDPSMDCADLDLSTSIEAIMDEMHPRLDIDGASAAAPEVTYSYYPDYSESICLNDNEQSEWLNPADVFNSVQDCCKKHFKWKMASCLENSPDVPAPDIVAEAESASDETMPDPFRLTNPPAKIPTRNPTPRPSRQPVSSKPTEKPMASSTGMHQSTLGATQQNKPELTPSDFAAAPEVTYSYYPDYSESICVNDNEQPEWLNPALIFNSVQDCCKKHFKWKMASCLENSPDVPAPDIVAEAESASEETMPDPFRLTNPPTKIPTRNPTPQPTDKLVASSTGMHQSTLGATQQNKPELTPSDFAAAPEVTYSYYPDYSESICVNDNEQPEWLNPALIFNSAQDCCKKQFKWKMASCLENSPDVPAPDIVAEAESASDETMPDPFRLTNPPTKIPTRNPTPQPTDKLVASSTGMHQSTLGATQQNKPEPTPQTKRPSSHPSPRPTRRPTERPIAKVMINSPWQSPTFPYEMFNSEPTIDVVQRPMPTKKPKKRKTRKPTPMNTAVGESPLAAGFLGRPISSLALTFPTEPQVPSSSKGSEQHLGHSIKNQIQQQFVTKKQKNGNKKGKRGQKKATKRAQKKKQMQKRIKQKQKKKNQMKRQKRQNKSG